MSEVPLRAGPLASPEYPEGATTASSTAAENPLPGMPAGRNLLPANTGANPRLNRSAERVGRTMAFAVCGVRGIPNRFGTVRSRMHVVGSRTRQNASAAAFEFMDSAAQRAGNWRDSARTAVAGAVERADQRWNEVSADFQDQLHRLQRAGAERFDHVRLSARQQFETTRHRLRRLEQEDPIKVLLAVGAVAFVAGAAIRVWRSRGD